MQLHDLCNRLNTRLHLAKILCGGRRGARRIMMSLLLVATISLLWIAAPYCLARARHDPWKDSGLENVGFFTTAERLNWQGLGYTSPPAFDELCTLLNSMEGCTAALVDYAVLELDSGEYAYLCIYPECLVQIVTTPLSEGSLELAVEDGSLPLVLDSRLKGRYHVGDELTVRISMGNYWNEHDTVTAKVTGFMNQDNDHLATLGGSNAHRLEDYAAKALGSDDLIMLTADGGMFAEKEFIGARCSILLLSDDDVHSRLAAWQAQLDEHELGTVISYQEVAQSDLWEIAILENGDYYILTLWLLALTCVGLIGYNVMQTEVLASRLEVLKLMGLNRRARIGLLWLGKALPFFLLWLLGVALGDGLVLSVYPDMTSGLLRLNCLALILLLPLILSMILDIRRVFIHESSH